MNKKQIIIAAGLTAVVISGVTLSNTSLFQGRISNHLNPREKVQTENGYNRKEDPQRNPFQSIKNLFSRNTYTSRQTLDWSDEGEKGAGTIDCSTKFGGDWDNLIEGYFTVDTTDNYQNGSANLENVSEKNINDLVDAVKSNKYEEYCYLQETVNAPYYENLNTNNTSILDKITASKSYISGQSLAQLPNAGIKDPANSTFIMDKINFYISNGPKIDLQRVFQLKDGTQIGNSFISNPKTINSPYNTYKIHVGLKGRLKLGEAAPKAEPNNPYPVQPRNK